MVVTEVVNAIDEMMSNDGETIPKIIYLGCVPSLVELLASSK
jgi:hypothetical protein